MKKVVFLLLFVCFFENANAQSKAISTKPTVNQISWEDPNIIDLFGLSPNANTPKTPNAGQDLGKEIPLNGSFTFNKKIGFMVNSPEGDMVAHFFLNTKNGYSMLDNEGLKGMTSEKMEGEMHQIFSPNADFYQYTKTSEGNFAMKMGSGQSMVMHDFQTADASKVFFKTFKKTGNKVGVMGGNKIPRIEYSGIYEGKKMSIWLSDAQDIMIDKRFTSALTGYFGLGYIVSPSGKTYLMTGFEGQGVSIFMTYIENCNKTFSSKGYQPIGNMMAAAMGQNLGNIENEYNKSLNEINKETDPKLRALQLEALNKAKKQANQTKSQAEIFAQSSDMRDMPYINQINDPKATAEYYDMMLNGYDQSIREHQLGLEEAQKNVDSKSVTRYNCMINCINVEKNRVTKMKAEHIKILEKYKNDDDLRDEKLNKLFETQGIPQACECI